jgi:hypothetical protein
MKSPYDVWGMKRLAYPYQVVMGKRDCSPWGNIRARGQGDRDRGDSYAVVRDLHGVVAQETSSERRAMSLSPSRSQLHRRDRCAHSSSSSDKADSDHSSKRYQCFNRSTCRRDEVKVRVRDYKRGMPSHYRCFSSSLRMRPRSLDGGTDAKARSYELGAWGSR